MKMEKQKVFMVIWVVDKWEAEKESVDKMIPWLRKNVRDFDYSESTFEIDLRFVGWDVIIMEVILLFQQIEQLQ